MMGDGLLGSIQGLFAFFILLVGILIGWFSNEKVKKEEKMTESDAYVRDHLLIQFMLNFYCDVNVEVESVYEAWINWLKEQEARHDERSKV